MTETNGLSLRRNTEDGEINAESGGKEKKNKETRKERKKVERKENESGREGSKGKGRKERVGESWEKGMKRNG